MNIIFDIAHDRRGSFAFMAGILTPVVFLAVGLALEFTSLLSKRADLQALADSAALAAASGIYSSDAERIESGRNFFVANASQQGLNEASVDLVVNASTVSVNASYRYPFLFNLFGSNLEISSNSVTSFEKTTNRVLDVVMCIDATTSMNPTIDAVKANSRTFPTKLANAIEARGLGTFDLMRARAIYFRDVYFYQDYFSTGTVWAESNFFSFPEEVAGFEDFVGSESGGGPYNTDFPESAYECLYKATTSNWFKAGDTIRAPKGGVAKKADEVTPLIVMWTDDIPKPTNDWGSRTSPENPPGMPDTDAKFVALWSNPAVIDQARKMFVLFGPCTRAGWSMGMALEGSQCGGSVAEGTNNMINGIADALAKGKSEEKVVLRR